jgi:hypothetical protein
MIDLLKNRQDLTEKELKGREISLKNTSKLQIR